MANQAMQMTGIQPMADDWKNTARRQKVVEQVEAHLQNLNKAKEIESTSFNKANSREEYITLVKTYISHLKNSAKNENTLGMQQTGPGHLQDPMVNLQNLTNRGQGVPSNQQIQMAPGMPGSQQSMQGHQQITIQQSQLNLIRQQQLQQLQQQQNMQNKLQMNQPTTVTVQPGMAFNTTMIPQQMTRIQGNFNPLTVNQTAAQVTGAYPGQPTPPQHQPGMVPSPAYIQQMSPVPQQPGLQQVPSPAIYMQPVPSPQQSMPSPVATVQRSGVPSPSISLNTPGNPSSVGSVPSPSSAIQGPGSVGHTSQEEQALIREKQQQLLQYVELLKNQAMILKDQGDKLKATKRMQAAQFLSEASKLNDLAKLTQYEQQIRKMTQGPYSIPNTAQTSAPVVPIIKQSSDKKNHQIYQPLLEAISGQLSSPTFNHNLKKAFGPAVDELHGSPSSFTASVMRRPMPEVTVPSGVSDIVQGEVARLHAKFRVTLDPAYLPDSYSVHLLCKLEDQFLPSVPPICVVIPENYPQVNPQYEINSLHCHTPFHSTVQKMFNTQLKRMPDLYTLTQLLDAWEMSVRLSCQYMVS